MKNWRVLDLIERMTEQNHYNKLGHSRNRKNKTQLTFDQIIRIKKATPCGWNFQLYT